MFKTMPRQYKIISKTGRILFTAERVDFLEIF
jgi:hypothetical protein